MSNYVPTPDERDGVVASLALAWVAVLFDPREFFRTGVVPGDQAPGLLFAVSVVLVSESLRFALAGNSYSVLAGRTVLSAVLWIAVAVLFVTPAVLHLVGAFQTILLVPLARDRGGVSETVQILAYASAPCVLSGVPVPEVRALVGIYATVLLAIGLSTVHRTSFERGLLAGAIPAAILYGYGFRAFDAIGTLLARWYII